MSEDLPLIDILSNAGFNDTSSWAGLVLGIGGILFSYIIYRRVGKIEKTRRDEQKQHFKKLVINNIEDALLIYDSASILAHRTFFTHEETNEKTIGLERLFSNKHKEIQNLVRDTKFYASMLTVIDSPTADMEKLVEKISWLTKEFYIMNYSIDRNSRHWVSLVDVLNENKDFIKTSLDSLRTQ